MPIFWRFFRIGSTFSALKMATELEQCFFPDFYFGSLPSPAWRFEAESIEPFFRGFRLYFS
ncbi:hypothetical protein EO94_11375 [Methanosarcina sp. 2.H.T.1A.3]|nr:hypothetical protein EO94_11375 [Methanosarcina sp. 2.H.T.1A.3]KKG26019.1 hypothetical protein EO96_16020 [Methanosarcina sp. 2.H.T.1A.8]